MRPLCLTALLVALSGCGPSYADLSDADLDEATELAIEAGDWDRAFTLQEEAAERGDVGALRALAVAHERGYVRIPAGPDRPQEYRRVWSLPGQAARMRERYEQALADGARAGEPEALLLVAQSFAGQRQIVNGEMEPLPEADRDSALAIYRQIADADLPRMSLALLAKGLGDDEAYRRHVDAAVAAREPNACTFKVWFTGTKRDLSTPTGFAEYVDALDGCGDPEATEHAADRLRPLAENVAAEAAEAAASRGEARQALRLYKRAAKQGDLDALNTVADAYERGYVRVGLGSPTRHLPIVTFLGQDRRWRARYERERDERARAGEPDVLMRVADDLTRGTLNKSAVAQDSARAIRQRLVDADYAPALLREALVSMREDSLAADALLRRAETAGSGQACAIRVSFSHREQVTASQIAAFIDDIEACPPFPGNHPRGGERIVQNLREAERNGDERATAHLDSLRAEGVFERHPRLAALLDET